MAVFGASSLARLLPLRGRMKTTTASAILPLIPQSTRDELIAQGIPLVKSIAVRLRAAYGLPASIDDLCAAGFTGLLEAIKRFDPSRGTAFTTFAYFRIRGAIVDLRRLGGERLPCLPVIPTAVAASADRRLALAPANDNARAVEEEPPSPPSSWVSADDGEITLLPFDQLDAFADEGSPGPDDEVQRKWDAEALRAALLLLPERERRVIELRYYEDKSFAEIAITLGLCKTWTFGLYERAINTLREALGVSSDVGSDQHLEDDE
jgi:RNA polymerase sigma factor for flagellar operon FliA